MDKGLKVSFFGLAFFLLLSGLVFSADQDVESLKKQVETLNKRVAELEAKQSKEPKEKRRLDQDSDAERWFWDPMAEMGRMREQMNQVFQDTFPSSRTPSSGSGLLNAPAFQDYDFNLEETKEGYVIKLDTTGLNKDKIDIQINQHSITISAESSSKTQEKNPQGSMYARSFGTFMKTVPLPVDADPEKMETHQEGNILIIKIPLKKT